MESDINHNEATRIRQREDKRVGGRKRERERERERER